MKYVIGMDGGGTKTQICVADSNRMILLRFQAGAINYNGGEKQEIDSNIRQIFRRILEEGFYSENCLGMCIGAAGISNPRGKEQIIKIVDEFEFRCPISILGDEETAFAGALDNKAGIILIAGTGSVCFGRDESGRACRMGGYGHIIGDEGSGYMIAKDILSAVAKAQDGRGEETALSGLVFRGLLINSAKEIVEYLYQPDRTKKEIAGLSRFLRPAYELGDKTACAILDKCVCELADLAIPMVIVMGKAVQLAVSGSVLLKNEVIFQKFKRKVQERFPETVVIKPCHDAAYGAILLALQLSKP